MQRLSIIKQAKKKVTNSNKISLKLPGVEFALFVNNPFFQKTYLMETCKMPKA